MGSELNYTRNYQVSKGFFDIENSHWIYNNTITNLSIELKSLLPNETFNLKLLGNDIKIIYENDLNPVDILSVNALIEACRLYYQSANYKTLPDIFGSYFTLSDLKIECKNICDKHFCKIILENGFTYNSKSYCSNINSLGLWNSLYNIRSTITYPIKAYTLDNSEYISLLTSTDLENFCNALWNSYYNKKMNLDIAKSNIELDVLIQDILAEKDNYIANN